MWKLNPDNGKCYGSRGGFQNKNKNRTQGQVQGQSQSQTYGSYGYGQTYGQAHTQKATKGSYGNPANMKTTQSTGTQRKTTQSTDIKFYSDYLRFIFFISRNISLNFEIEMQGIQILKEILKEKTNFVGLAKQAHTDAALICSTNRPIRKHFEVFYL